MEGIVWRAQDGRTSSWSRMPPDGPVFFDAPPNVQLMPEHPQWATMLDYATSSTPAEFVQDPNSASWMPPSGTVYFWVNSDVFMSERQTEWKELRLPDDMEEQETEEERIARAQRLADLAAMSPAAPTGNNWLNPAAAEFVPSNFGNVEEMLQNVVAELSPQVDEATVAAPKPQPSPASVAALEVPATHVHVTEETPEMRASGTRLEWFLPDNWGKLSRFPKDFCITSPMFGVPSATNMQLVFYPNAARQLGLANVPWN